MKRAPSAFPADLIWRRTFMDVTRKLDPARPAGRSILRNSVLRLCRNSPAKALDARVKPAHDDLLRSAHALARWCSTCADASHAAFAFAGGASATAASLVSSRKVSVSC